MAALNTVLILVQGWSCFSPSFNVIGFVSFYIELPVLVAMFIIWKLIKRTSLVRLSEVDLVTDRYDLDVSQPAHGTGEGEIGVLEGQDISSTD